MQCAVHYIQTNMLHSVVWVLKDLLPIGCSLSLHSPGVYKKMANCRLHLKCCVSIYLSDHLHHSLFQTGCQSSTLEVSPNHITACPKIGGQVEHDMSHLIHITACLEQLAKLIINAGSKSQLAWTDWPN